MDTLYSASSSYLSAASRYLTQNVQGLHKDLFNTGIRATASSTSKSASNSAKELAIGGAGDAAAGASDLIHFPVLTKAFGLGVASAAVMGSAFYMGYQLAKRKHRFHVRGTDKNDKIEQILGKLKLSKEYLNKIMALMFEEMQHGLDPATHANADVKMFPTYVRSLPDGTERGDILALDLGGTNFRVLLVNLDSGEIKVKSKVFLIPQSIMTGSGIKLFDHIAKCLAEFMKAEHLICASKPYPLGFTFSFPCTQNGLASATLVTWTKGFDCEGVVGNDVVFMLQEAIDRRGVCSFFLHFLSDFLIITNNFYKLQKKHAHRI